MCVTLNVITNHKYDIDMFHMQRKEFHIAIKSYVEYNKYVNIVCRVVNMLCVWYSIVSLTSLLAWVDYIQLRFIPVLRAFYGTSVIGVLNSYWI